MKLHNSIGFRIASAIGLMALVAFIGIFIVVSTGVRATLNNMVRGSSLQILEARADEIDRIIESYQKLILTLSLQEVFIHGSEREAEEAAYSMVGKLGEEIPSVFIVWPDGQATTTPGTYINIADRPYVKAIYQEGKDKAMSDPLISRNTGNPAVIMVQAIRNPQGQTRAILAVEMALTRVNQSVRQIDIGSTSYAWVVDKNGMIFSSGIRDLEMKLNITQADEEGGYRGLSALSKKILETRQTVGSFMAPRGEERAVFTTKISEEYHWTLGIVINTSSLFAPLSRLTWFLVAIMAAALALATAVAAGIGRWISNPLRKVTWYFSDPAAGEADRSKGLEISRKDEIGVLAREILNQDRMLHAVNEAAVILLTPDDHHFKDALSTGMEMMGRCVDIDRVRIWKNSSEQGRIFYTEICEWIEGTYRAGAPGIRQDSFPEWEEKLSRGEFIAGVLRNMPERIRERLAPWGIKSVLIVPVFLQNIFWGFVSFGDCHRERDFSPGEKSILRSGALLVANALVRNEMTISLVEARERALSGAKAKSDFLANMSHEMRTPMNAIIGMTSIAKAAADIERKDYCLRKIDEASTHLLGVINDILDISKIEANKFELAAVDFNFERMLRKVTNVINFKVDEKHQKFTVHIDKNIPPALSGDDQRLTQVITNLLSNAVKFTPEQGSIRLDTQLVGEKDLTCTIKISVTDTGIGIEKEQQERLFKSFEQADSGISRKFGGTGLGLAISKRIVEMMGGRIWVDSIPGKGSTFAFTMQAKRGTEASGSPLSSGINWKNVRVLAVDDEPDTRSYFQDIAQRIGLRCDTASGGPEAIGMIRRNEGYDIYFVDWKMPGMDGMELARHIKRGDENKSVIIMISSAEWAAIEEAAKDAGVDKFLPKPLFPSAIADVINECLGTGTIIAAKESQSDTEKTGAFAGCRILLAEDVEINREIVLTLLEPYKADIRCAENGLEAVNMFSSDPDNYDMIFMDVQMPEMDGYEATRRIRSSGYPQARRIPIVAMTANVFREDIEKCLEAGMDDHVGKPLDIGEVLSKLWKFLPLKPASPP